MRVTLWGTGTASREFLFVRDAADAVVRAAARIDDPAPMNLGTGREIRFGGPPGLDLAALGQRLDATVDEVRPGEYRVATEATPAAVAALTAWLAARDLPLADLRAGRQTLEDVFLRLTGVER